MDKKIFLILLTIVVVGCQNLQTSTAGTTTNPAPLKCNPLLMRRLSNPTSMVPDNQALKRLFETIILASDPSTILNDLTYYTPRFTGFFLNFIQSIHFFKKKVQNADPELRQKCLIGFTSQTCLQLCQTDTIAAPKIDWDSFKNITITQEPILPQCDVASEQLFLYLMSIIIQDERQEFFKYKTKQQLQMEELIKLKFTVHSENAKDPEKFYSSCPYSSKNSFQTDDCLFQQFYKQQVELYPNSYLDLGYQDQSANLRSSSESSTRPQMNLISIVEAMRRLLNRKFGKGVFAEASLKCIRGSYLYEQSLPPE